MRIIIFFKLNFSMSQNIVQFWTIENRSLPLPVVYMICAKSQSKIPMIFLLKVGRDSTTEFT